MAKKNGKMGKKMMVQNGYVSINIMKLSRPNAK